MSDRVATYTSTTALVVVDVQRAFMHPEQLNSPSPMVLSSINAEIAAASTAGATIIYTLLTPSSGYAPDGRLCPNDALGAEFHPDLAIVGRVVSRSPKCIPGGYSALSGSSELGTALDDASVSKVVLVGLPGSVGLWETSSEAAASGLDAEVLRPPLDTLERDSSVENGREEIGVRMRPLALCEFLAVPLVAYQVHPALVAYANGETLLGGRVLNRIEGVETTLEHVATEASRNTWHTTALRDQLACLSKDGRSLIDDVQVAVMNAVTWTHWERGTLERFFHQLHKEYFRYLHHLNRKVRFRERSGPLTEPAATTLAGLRALGAVPMAVEPALKQGLLLAVMPLVDRLRQEDAVSPDGFSSRSIPLSRLGIWNQVRTAIAPLGLVQIARHYLGYPVALTHIELHVNRPGNRYFSSRYSDMGLPCARAAGIHFDSGSGMVKAMVYLSQVTEDSGPFRYALSSHRWRLPHFRRFAGQALVSSGVRLEDENSRRLFMRLPEVFRQLSHFGADFLGEDSEARLLDYEQPFTSGHGDVVIFDNSGLHRGGVLPERERIALQLQFSARGLLERSSEFAWDALWDSKRRVSSRVALMVEPFAERKPCSHQRLRSTATGADREMEGCSDGLGEGAEPTIVAFATS